MADIKSGLYVTELIGTGANIVTGDYSRGASGFWIDNGELAFPVSEITIAGQSCRRCSQISSPPTISNSAPSNNAPTCRVEGLTIAGA